MDSCHRVIRRMLNKSSSTSRHALSAMYPGVEIRSLTERRNTPGIGLDVSVRTPGNGVLAVHKLIVGGSPDHFSV
jgi:hypothetical protein